VCLSPDGKILSSQQKFYPTQFSANGFAEQNAELIFESVHELIKSSIIKSATCIGLSFSSAMHTITAVDHEGKVLMPLIIWSDTRSTEQSKKMIQSGYAQRFYEISGTPIHPMSPLCKLLWLKENQSGLFYNTFKFISIKEYVLSRLTGEYFIDHSIASATGLFDLEKKEWSEEILNYIGITKEKFPTPVPTNKILQFKETVAADLSLDKSTPLIIGASDGCLAQLGSNAMNEDDLTITIGTSGAVRVASTQIKNDPQGKIFNYILHDGIFISGGATNCGTALITWFRESMNKISSENLEEFVKQAEKIQAGSEGLICVPFLLGERAPVYDPEATGTFFGVRINHSLLHFQKALLEGICFEIKWIMESIENSFGRKNNIIVSGGITHSKSWVQMLSNVIGRKIIVTSETDASTLGAAKLGFETLGLEYKIHNSSNSEFYPEATVQSIYENQFVLIKKIYFKLKDLKSTKN
jgi:gluconokinase